MMTNIFYYQEIYTRFPKLVLFHFNTVLKPHKDIIMSLYVSDLSITLL